MKFLTQIEQIGKKMGRACYRRGLKVLPDWRIKKVVPVKPRRKSIIPGKNNTDPRSKVIGST